MEADAEVGDEEKQLSIALVVESKETGKKRKGYSSEGSQIGLRGWEDKTLLSKTLFLALRHH